MKTFLDVFELLAKGLIVWLQALASPLKAVTSVLAVGELEKRTANLSTIWIWSLLIAIPFQIPLLRMYGIDVGQAEFLLAQALLNSLTMGLLFLFTQLGLKLCGVPSRLSDTFSVYVITVVIYSPISTLMLLPDEAADLSIVREVKSASATLDDAINGFIKVVGERSQSTAALDLVSTTAAPFSSAAILWSSAIFVECLWRIYGGSRFRILLGVTLGEIIAIPFLTIAMRPLEVLLMWAYVK
jgi:hypothetical protein